MVDNQTFIQGQTGAQGETGAQGLIGLKGDRGSQGYTGVSGETGIQGLQGLTGYTGLQGLRGSNGFTGPIGYQGTTGLKGETGVKGERGEFGFTGFMGFTGSQGSTGSQGETGISGSTGLRGTQGITGLRGLTGIQGYTGLQGPVGQTGSQGYQGDTGAGPQGATGLEGPRGDGFYPKGALNDSSLLPDYGNSNGDAYYIVNSGHLFVWQYPNWIDMGDISGFEGATGLRGSTGLSGVKGDTGSQGNTGIQGITGLSIQGITGLIGASGVQGETGVRGVTGLSPTTSDILNTQQGQGTTAISNTKISPTDTISQAFLNIQKQINYYSSPSVAPQWTKSTDYAPVTNYMYQLLTPSNYARVNIGYDNTYYTDSSSEGVQVITDGSVSSNSPIIYLDTYDNLNTNHPVPEVKFRKAHGYLLNHTQAAVALSDEVIGRISGNSFNGASFATNAKIEFSTSESQTSVNRGGNIDLSIVKKGTTSFYKAIRIGSFSGSVANTVVQISGQSATAGSMADNKSALDIGGSAVTRPYTYASGSTFDLSKSNAIVVTAPTGSSFTLSNIQDGGAYTLAFQDTSSTITPSFSYTKAEDGSSTGLTFIYNPAIATRTSGKHWVASIVRMGNYVYFSYIEF